MQISTQHKSLIFLLIMGLAMQKAASQNTSSIVHEAKLGYMATAYANSIGLFYEMIPKTNFGYELGIAQGKNSLYFPCPRGCSDPNTDPSLFNKTYDWQFWTFTMSLKYYLNKKKDATRFYVGAFGLYLYEIKASISEEFKQRLTVPIPYDRSPNVYTNRLSFGGLTGYKFKPGQHLIIEPMAAVGLNVNSPYDTADLEYLLLGRIGWRF